MNIQSRPWLPPSRWSLHIPPVFLWSWSQPSLLSTWQRFPGVMIPHRILECEMNNNKYCLAVKHKLVSEHAISVTKVLLSTAHRTRLVHVRAMEFQSKCRWFEPRLGPLYTLWRKCISLWYGSRRSGELAARNGLVLVVRNPVGITGRHFLSEI